MIKIIDSNNVTHNITRLYKDGHEILKSYENGRLIYSPYIIMGTIYASQTFTITSTNTPPVTSTFEILGQAGTDTDGTYYKFGMRLPDRADNNAVYSQSHFSNVINNIVIQLNALNILRSVDLFSTPFFYLGVINRLVNDRHNTKFKEIDFKDFNVQNATYFQPCTFAPALTTIKNMDKLDFKQNVSWKEAFRYLHNIDTFICGSKSLYHINSLEQAFQESTGLSLVNFAQQDQDNTICTSLNNAFMGCTNINRIDIANLRLVNLTDVNAAFRNCYNLYHNPLGGLPTSGITQWQNTYENCRTLNGSQFDTNDYSGAVNMASCFKGCTGITSLDLSTKNLSNCANFDSTWHGCTQLSSLSLPAIKPMYMQYAFRSTALYNIPANIDFSECLNAQGTFYKCANFEGYFNWSSHDFSVIKNAKQMFYGCSGVLGITFASTNAFHKCTNFVQFLERCTLMQYVYNLDLTSAANLSSLFHIDGQLKTVTGTKPSGAVQITNMTTGCTSLERFIDFSNIKLENESQFSVGMVPKNANDLHIETWTNKDGTGKPVVVGYTGTNLVVTSSDTTNAYPIDFAGWTFLSGIRASGGLGSIQARSYFPINLNGIKVRMVKNTSNNSLIPIQGYTAYDQCYGLTSIDTTNWLDNSEIPSLTKVVFATNGAMFQRCTNLATIKLKNVMTQENYDGTVNNNNSLNTFTGCSAVTSFECDIDFINTQMSNDIVLNFPLWTNATEIEAFLTQLATTTTRRKTYGDGNNTVVKFSTNTYNVITGLSNWSTLSNAITSHGWTIVSV